MIGVPLGIWLASSPRWGERWMRFLDAFQALPLLILILALVALSNNQLWMIVVAVAIYAGPVYIRLVRSQVLSLREARFIEAAHASGAGPYRIMRYHLLPNVRGVILAQTSLVAAGALLGITALSFLGVGVQPPTPSWGSMIALDSSALVEGHWWPVIGPGIAIFLSIVAFNLVADGLRELGRTACDERRPRHRPRPHGQLLRPAQAAVRHVSLSLGRGEFHGLVGESGSGKSNVARAVLGLTDRGGKVLGGSVVVDDLELLGISNRRLRRIRGQKVSTSARTRSAPSIPSEHRASLRTDAPRAQGLLRRAEGRARALALLDQVGIHQPETVMRSYVHQLSGGMAQRIVIALAMFLEPDLIVADEPTTGLDVTIQRQTLDLLTEQARARGGGTVADHARSRGRRAVLRHDDRPVRRPRHGVGPRRQRPHRTRHPYTQGLVSSVPVPGVPLTIRPRARTPCSTKAARSANAAPSRLLSAPAHPGVEVGRYWRSYCHISAKEVLRCRCSKSPTFARPSGAVARW